MHGHDDMAGIRKTCTPNSSQMIPVLVGAQAFVDKFRFNAKRAALVQSRIKAIERMADIELVEADPEYCFRC